MKALLLSGGMDSISVAWWKRPDVAITVDYGQQAAAAEIAASRAICEELKIRHDIIVADCSSLGSGDMAGKPPASDSVVPEWWPFRNQLLITLCGMLCIRLGVTEVLVGSLSTDDSHRDGTSTFFQLVDALMAYQEGGITVSAPAIGMDAPTLVHRSGVPKRILSWAHSCHVGSLACGTCRGCVKHYKTWEALGWTPH